MCDAVSILVITRDRRDFLVRVLTDLGKQQYPGTFEVIVVEETDQPLTPKGVCYVPHPVKNLGIAYARNMSVEHANYDILVFIDDDCRVEPDWLEKLVAPLQDQNVLGAQGGVVVPEGTNAIGWAECLLGFPGGGITRIYQAQGRVKETREVSTLNACYRKEAVIKVGGFSKHARFGGEDFLLAKKVAELGKLLFVPQALVQHEARGSMPAIWVWFLRRGRAEFDLWHSGLAPAAYGSWLIRSSLSLKLFPLLFLCMWSAWPFFGMVTFIVGMNLWRYRWVIEDKRVSNAAWVLLPWVRMTMSIASDAGRFLAWLNKIRGLGK